MSTLLKDLRYGLLMLARSPGINRRGDDRTGLGIGANSAIFSVVNAVLLRPLPYKDASRLIVIWETKLSKGICRSKSLPRLSGLGRAAEGVRKTRRSPGSSLRFTGC